MRLKLIYPDLNYAKEITEYKKEFLKNGESMDGCSFLEKMQTVEQWLNFIDICSQESTVPDNLVPSRTYLAIRENDNTLIGMINIRLYLNNYLKLVGGNIGYSVKIQERNKGYATEMLGLGLTICKELNISPILVTCKRNNIASRKVIEKNGGTYIDEILYEQNYYQRFIF